MLINLADSQKASGPIGTADFSAYEGAKYRGISAAADSGKLIWPLYGLMLVQPLMECTGSIIAVLPEEKTISAREIVYIPIHLTDAEGNRNVSTETLVGVKVEGAGTLLVK